MSSAHKDSSGLFHAAILISIPAFLMAAWGIWIGGWPSPNQTAPVHFRLGLEQNEVTWRATKARASNDRSLWNEKAQLVLLFPSSERSARQDEMVKDGILDESSRLRNLTAAEQSEMEARIRVTNANNARMIFSQYWTFFGMPLSLLAMVLSSLSFVVALWKQVRGKKLAVMVVVTLLNCVVLMLTYWNACGTSLG